MEKHKNIDWFIKIVEKSNQKFSMFGITKDFYPSSKEALLIKAVPLNETHLAVVRGTSRQEVSTQVRQQEELIGASLLCLISTNKSS